MTKRVMAVVAVGGWLLAGCGGRAEKILLLGDGDLAAFAEEEGTGDGSVTVVDVTGAGFDQALRITAAGDEEFRVSAPVNAAVSEGDVLLAQFSARGGRTEVRFEPGLSRWSPPLRMAARAEGEWERFEYPFRVRRSYAPGEAKLVFVGQGAGGVELGGIEVVNYGTTKALSELKCTRLDYAGSEPAAAWRKAAEERIEKIRKGDLTVIVHDSLGAPVADANVAVSMKRHAFGWGSAVNVGVLQGQRDGVKPGDVGEYRRQIVKLFNKVVFENALKWQSWAKPEGRERALESVQWAREQGLKIRGHVLVWPSWRWLPEDLRKLEGNPKALRKAVVEHIMDETSTLGDQIAEWDVMNEPYSNHDLMDILGKEVMVEWFQEARKAAPEAKLFINDYDILSGEYAAHRQHYEDTIRYLLENKAPLDGIGLQGHFKSEVTPPEELLRRLDQFAPFGKALQVTEFDIDTIDQQLQAGYTRDAMTVLFSHPSVTGFLMWGFWEGRHWIPNGAMYNRDWSPKPNARAYEELVFKRWWTEENGKTDGEGQYGVRGFQGDYEVEVRRGEKSRTVEVHLPRDGATVSVEI